MGGPGQRLRRRRGSQGHRKCTQKLACGCELGKNSGGWHLLRGCATCQLPHPSLTQIWPLPTPTPSVPVPADTQPADFAHLGGNVGGCRAHVGVPQGDSSQPCNLEPPCSHLGNGLLDHVSNGQVLSYPGVSPAHTSLVQRSPSAILHPCPASHLPAER